MPPPTISMRFGSLGSSSAPVEVTTRGSSLGMKGSFTASEPAAMTARAKPMVVVPPAASSTLTWWSSLKRPVPVTTVTLRILAICARPPVRRPTTLFLCATSLARSTVGGAEADAELVEVRDLVHDRGDVQHRLRRDAADVQADAAERRRSARRARP